MALKIILVGAAGLLAGAIPSAALADPHFHGQSNVGVVVGSPYSYGNGGYGGYGTYGGYYQPNSGYYGGAYDPYGSDYGYGYMSNRYDRHHARHHRKAERRHQRDHLRHGY